MPTRTTFLLSNIAAVSFIAIAATPSVVLAQSAQGVVANCVSDVRTWCGVATLVERQACIKTHFREFSLPCQLAAVKYAAIKKVCGRDIKKNCAGILPGGGRIEVCIKDHFADMSEKCKVTISQAADKGS